MHRVLQRSTLRFLSLTLPFLTGAAASLARADSTDNFAYVRATSQLDRDVNPSKYHPLNLIDHDPTTIWCEGKAGLGDGEGVTFYFKAPQTIDRIVLTLTYAGGRQISSMRFTDGSKTVKMNIKSDGAQSIEEVLSTPLRGDTYQLLIEHVGELQKDAVFPADVACLADVALYHGTLLLNPTTAARDFDIITDRLVGAWSHEPLGASESSILFSVDGTWAWSHEPLTGGKRESQNGTYRMRNGHLQMRKGTAGHFVNVDVRFHHVEVDKEDMNAPSANYDTLDLGNGLGKEFGGTYNNAKFN